MEDLSRYPVRRVKPGTTLLELATHIQPVPQVQTPHCATLHTVTPHCATLHLCLLWSPQYAPHCRRLSTLLIAVPSVRSSFYSPGSSQSVCQSALASILSLRTLIRDASCNSISIFGLQVVRMASIRAKDLASAVLRGADRFNKNGQVSRVELDTFLRCHSQCMLVYWTSQ